MIATMQPRILAPASPIAWIDEDMTASPPAPKTIVLVVDPDDGRVWIERQHSIDGVSEAAWHGRLVECSIPTNANAQYVAEWVNGPEFGALLDRVRAGYAGRWDGSNHVGSWSDDANAAADQIAETLRDWPSMDEGGFVEAADWFDNMGRLAVAEEYGVAADTTDDDLYGIAERIDAEAKSDDWYLSQTLGYLESVREAVAIEAEYAR